MNASTSSQLPTIRAATERDLAPAIALLERSALPTVGLADALGGLLVAELGGDVVGVIAIEPHGNRFALLRSAAIAEASRHRGIGRALVERAIDSARAQRLESLYLLTTTAEDYFPRFGFSRVMRDEVPAAIQASEEFSSACPASAAVMVLQLVERSS